MEAQSAELNCMAFRARNLRLQTRKMRVKIQFCELKILALEKSCEFNNLPVANTKSYLGLKDVYK